MTSYDVVIIGGGISGIWTAYVAAGQGKKVALIDPSLGSGGTGRCAGIHTTQLALEIDVKLSKRSLEMLDELAEKSECNEIREKCGFLSVEEAWMAQESSKTLARLGVAHRLLSKEELSKLVPDIIVKDEELGVYTPSDVLINISSLYSAMRKILGELNVAIYEHVLIKTVEEEEGYVVAVRSNNHVELKGENYVFAAGPWNKDILHRSGVWSPPTTIYICQALSFSRSAGMKIIPTYFQDSHVYLRPEGISQLIVGNGYAKIVDDPDDYPARAEPEYVEEVSEKLCERLVDPSQIRFIGGWSGPCSTTPDGYPLLGRIPALKNAYIIDGLDGYGIMRAPAMAELLIHAIAKNTMDKLPSEFDPARFNGLKKYEPKVIELHS
jgi:glycine/D-amino acid oxidase-like deaminating enzyme